MCSYEHGASRFHVDYGLFLERVQFERVCLGQAWLEGFPFGVEVFHCATDSPGLSISRRCLFEEREEVERAAEVRDVVGKLAAIDGLCSQFEEERSRVCIAASTPPGRSTSEGNAAAKFASKRYRARWHCGCFSCRCGCR